MFKQILVPLDGSARAEQALPVAACLARATDGTVKLIKVVPPPTTEFIRSVGTVVLPDLLDEDVQAAQEYLEGIAKASCLEGIRTVREVSTGHPAQAIIAAAKADHADLIVIYSHGQTSRVRWSLGSIAEKVARYAPCPVFILREDTAFATKMEAIPRGPIRKHCRMPIAGRSI
jgi:nucleotide-binding universal stress UspA family protein